jgi:hypothetical protein
MTALQVVSAIALAENLVQVEFTEAIYFSLLLDPPDGSNAALYSLTTVAGTVGMDGTAIRPCSVVAVALATPQTDLPPNVAFGSVVDLTLDRPMTPWPAEYTITCSGVYSADLSTEINPSFASATFPATFKQLLSPSVDLPTPTRDIANPQSLAGMQGTRTPFNPLQLGVFVTDDQHDYAADSGIVSFRKRLYRRLVTNPGGFLHLGQTYGIGIPSQGKKLATASVQQALASQVQQQIAQEPEVAACGCTVVSDPNNPGLIRFNIRVRLKSGKTFAYSAPFSM